MSTIKSSDEHLTLNADGSSKDIKFQANGVEKASISSSGAFTSTTIDATKLTGDLPAISGANLTGVGVAGISSSADATAMTITSAEKIGIGTATPICLVELEHSNTTALSGDGDDSAINIHNTGGVNAISTISFSGGDHNGDGNLAGIYAKHTNVTENSETTDIGFKTSVNEAQVDNLILRGDRGLSQFTAKAWVRYGGTSSTIAVADSHNVSSVTHQQVGIYRINYANNLANANYVSFGNDDWYGINYFNSYTTSSVQHTHLNNNWTNRDTGICTALIFGD
jgi:hypothetical protein